MTANTIHLPTLNPLSERIKENGQAPAQTRPGFWPEVPYKVEDLGIPRSSVIDLILRRLYAVGTGTLETLSATLKLSWQVVETVFHQLRQQQLVEVKGMVGNDYTFVLTANGRAMAAERVEMCSYAGPAPVSIQDYHRSTRAQTAKVSVNRATLRKAFGDLVVTDAILDQLGPSLISQKSLFLYGPTGNGKTSLAERMLRVYTDRILIPHAVEVDGQVIMLYDPVVHHKLDTHDEYLDPRWMVCQRPFITVGGELVPSMLELRLDESSGVYAAPFQMKANNGILLIDDFGRQVMSPRELLNRWIVPLDRRVDYLSLRYGVKFQIPFETMVVFSTNLDPQDLADEAFLRRIQNKIFVDVVAPETFDEIFRRVVAERNLPCEPGVGDYFRELVYPAQQRIARLLSGRFLQHHAVGGGIRKPSDESHPGRVGPRRSAILHQDQEVRGQLGEGEPERAIRAYRAATVRERTARESLANLQLGSIEPYWYFAVRTLQARVIRPTRLLPMVSSRVPLAAPLTVAAR